MTGEEAGALKLAAILWIFAAGARCIGQLVYRVLSLRLQSDGWSLYDFVNLFEAPAVFDGAAQAFYSSWLTLSLIGRFTIALTLIASLIWTASCWLVAEPREARPLWTSRWLRCAAVFALIAGLAFHFAMPLLSPRVSRSMWIAWPFVDPILAALVTLQLRVLSREAPERGLRLSVQTLSWLVGAALITLVAQGISADNNAANRWYRAQQLLTLGYSVAFIVVMVQLQAVITNRIENSSTGSINPSSAESREV